MLTPYIPTVSIGEKLASKHGVTEPEVAELFRKNPQVFLHIRRDKYGDRVYRAVGRTNAGRYLAAFFVKEEASTARIITVRPMNEAERRRYRRRQA